MEDSKGICRVCGKPLKKHPYKGWYHPDGAGKGHRDHHPAPCPNPAEWQARQAQDDAAEADAQEADDATRAAQDPY